MNQTWVNVYKSGDIGQSYDSAKRAEWWAGSTLVRVEHRIDGHWLRPPVGMRGSDASHYRSGNTMVKR